MNYYFCFIYSIYYACPPTFFLIFFVNFFRLCFSNVLLYIFIIYNENIYNENIWILNKKF